MKANSIAVSAIISIIAGLLAYQVIYSNNFHPNSDDGITINTNQSLISSCTFLIFKVHGQANDTAARNCDNGSIEFSGPDSANVINNVLEQINKKGGGVVYVKGYGTSNPYLIKRSLIIPDNGHLTLIGDGPEFTVLKIPTGSDNNLFEFVGEKERNSFFNEFRNFEGIGNIGRGASNNTGFFLNSTRFGVSDSLWYNIFLRDFKQDDIYFGQQNSWNNKIDSSTIELAGRAGLYRTGGIDSSDARIINSKFLFNNQFGVYDGADFGTYTSNWFYKNNQTAMQIDGGAKSVIVANRFQDNGVSSNSKYYDLLLSSSYVDVSSNIFYGSETGLNAIKSAIKIDAYTKGNLITDNVIGNGYFGSSKIFIEPQSEEDIVLSNQGWNPIGVVPMALNNAQKAITPTGGNSRLPVAGSMYTVKDTELVLTSVGGSGVNITIKDPAGNTVVDGLKELQGQLVPQGYRIDFGKFSIAPTLTFAFN